MRDLKLAVELDEKMSALQRAIEDLPRDRAKPSGIYERYELLRQTVVEIAADLHFG